MSENNKKIERLVSRGTIIKKTGISRTQLHRLIKKYKIQNIINPFYARTQLYRIDEIEIALGVKLDFTPFELKDKSIIHEFERLSDA
jgi:hypothetical protein